MSEERVRFDTDVAGIWGLWPVTPDLWSYSSLKEVEGCPRRWMLSRADYPNVWEGHGYPSSPVMAAVFGNVVHEVVERLTDELSEAGITSPSDVGAVGLLNSLGGWKGLVLASIEKCTKAFEDNPRVSAERLDRLRDELVRRAPEAADQVKGFLGREGLPDAADRQGQTNTHHGDRPKQRYPAGQGAHAEREVTCEELHLTGRIDLLQVDDVDVTMTDFKTGAEDEAHDEQVRMYALLWDLDRQTNPSHRPATRLRVAYPSRERTVEAPTTSELRLLEAATASRIQSADAVTREASPSATPSETTCQFCQVRHLCDTYWPAVPPRVSDVPTDVWFDFEGRVKGQNGNRSWRVTSLDSSPVEVLVRTLSPVSFPIGKRVRLIGVRRSQDPDDEARLVISMTATSEWFALST